MLIPTRKKPGVHYRTASIDGMKIFYREAGPKDGPVLLLLHGFPTSSNMFRTIIPALASTYRVIAPDYPGFGLSAMPDRKDFSYTFENITGIVEKLIELLKVGKFSMYVMDYGAPIGFRLALRRPDDVEALIIQNGNAYEEGLASEFWDPVRGFWKNPSPENRDALRMVTNPKSTRWQYENGVEDTTLLDPTAWMIDQQGLDRPGNQDIQLDLLYDYRTNAFLYPRFQEFFRTYRPPTLLVWGQNDTIFPPFIVDHYKKDLEIAEAFLFDTGHFALETHGDEIASLIDAFLSKRLGVLKAAG